MPFRKFQISNLKFQISKRGFTRQNFAEQNLVGFTLKTRSGASEKSPGFTLIELLIVVAIIAVLVGVGSVSFTTARRQGRDATRQADLEKVASALEQYFSDNTSYPQDNAGVIQCDDNPIPNDKAWGSSFSCVVGSETKVYLQELPQEPTGNDEYFYEPQDRSGNPCTAALFNCQQFIISANLENGNHPAITAGLPCAPQGGYNYCIVSPEFEKP